MSRTTLTRRIENSENLGGDRMDDSTSDEQFNTLFPKEEDCFEYLKNIRWPNGFVCPKCQNNKCWVMGDGLLKCTNCKEKTSITSHTIFHRTKQPLRSWFHFIWVITHSEYGNKISDLGKRFSLERKTTVEWVDRIHDIITKHLIPEKPSRTINKPLDIHVLGSKKNNVICLHTDLFITENYDQIWIAYRSNEIKEFWDYICHLDRYAAREQELYMQEPNGLRTLVTPHNYNLQLTLSLLYKQRTILEEKLKKIGAPTSLLNHTEKGILDEQLRMINESISVTGIDHNLQMTLLDLNNKKTILKKELRMIGNSTSLLQSKNKKTILKKNKEITPEPEEELRKMGKWIYSLFSEDKKNYLEKRETGY